MARLVVRSDSIQAPQRGTRGAFPYPDSLREKHAALTSITSDDNISYPDMLSRSLTKVSKSYYVIPIVCHGPRSATCRAKGQEWWQVTSHDLWQPRRLPRSLSAARRVMMALPPPRGIMTSQKVSPPLKSIKEGGKAPNTIYKDLHTRRKVSLLYLAKGQLINLSNHGWQNHRRVCPDTLSGHLL